MAGMMARVEPLGADAHALALRTTHDWFEVNSGWAPPDPGTLEEWLADGVCRAPDDCLVAPQGTCPHGLASWALVLSALADEDAAHHRPPRAAPTTTDPA